MRFHDRAEAGKKLAEALQKYNSEDVVVYALPRGGVVLGAEIAKALGCLLDLVITRKIGHPQQKEYAVCAVAEDGDYLCDQRELAALPEEWFNRAKEKEQKEAQRRRNVYLGGRAPLSAEGKIAILVDDGIATGLTMRLAVREIKHMKPKQVIVAVPVSPADSAERLRKEVDEFVALDVPEFFLGGIGAYYDDFPQVEDSEVIKLLKENTGR